MLDELSSAVAELMTAACEQLVLPRFRRLSSEEIETKSGPNDLVTVADREAELFLTPRLLDLVDGEVIGEEACASDPGFVRAPMRLSHGPSILLTEPAISSLVTRGSVAWSR